jgi:hypothetical protein
MTYDINKFIAENKEFIKEINTELETYKEQLYAEIDTKQYLAKDENKFVTITASTRGISKFDVNFELLEFYENKSEQLSLALLETIKQVNTLLNDDYKILDTKLYAKEEECIKRISEIMNTNNGVNKNLN